MRLLTETIRALPEREQAIVLGFLLDRALVPPEPSVSRVRTESSFTVNLGGEAIQDDLAARWPRTGALLLLYQAAAGVPCAQLASELGLDLDVLHAVCDDLARRLHNAPRLAAVFGELGHGNTLGQAAENLGLSPDELAAEIQPTDDLIQTVSAALMARTALPRAPAPYVGYSPKGPLRTVPVRIPEEHYQRLKQWSEEHSFPMAVIVRGLVERFLDDQRPRPV